MKITVWTWTRDGDNLPVTTSVYPTREAAVAALRDELSADPSTDEAALCEAWETECDGMCSIESHDIDMSLTIWVTAYEDKHTSNPALAGYATEAEARGARNDHAADNWDDHFDDDEDKPSDPEELADAYFDRVSEGRSEYMAVDSITIR